MRDEVAISSASRDLSEVTVGSSLDNDNNFCLAWWSDKFESRSKHQLQGLKFSVQLNPQTKTHYKIGHNRSQCRLL
jgi:hypothetical protein